MPIGFKSEIEMAEKFADPKVDREIVDMVQDVTENNQPVYPWDVLEKVEESGVEKKEARKALRKLKMGHNIVPTKEMKGKIRLAKRLE